MPSIAIVGASANPERYSHKAVVDYAARGWQVWPVHPSGIPVAGHATLRTLADLPGQPDIVCFYVNPATGLDLLDAVVACKPQILWLNPGADGPEIAEPARTRGLRVVEACALVALRLGDPLKHR